jgi:hypothetical protein
VGIRNNYQKIINKLQRSFIFQKLIQENVSSKFVKAIESMSAA